jgi:hypothetical protein
MRWKTEVWFTLALAILPLLLTFPLHAAQVRFQNGGLWNGAAAMSQPQKQEGRRQIQDGVPAEDRFIPQDGCHKQYGGQGQDGFHKNDGGDEKDAGTKEGVGKEQDGGHSAQSGQAKISGQKQDGGRRQDKEYIRDEIHAQDGGKGQTGDLNEKGHHIYPRIIKRAADMDLEISNKDDNQSNRTGDQLYLEQRRVVTKCCPPGEALVSQNPPSCAGTGSAPLNFTGNSNCAFSLLKFY